MKDVVEIFDEKCNKILNDNECQSSSFANDPESGLDPVMFSLNDLDIAINKFNQGKGFDHVHSLHFKHVKSSFRNLLCNFINKILPHTYIPTAMLKGRIRRTVKFSSGTETNSQNCTPELISSNFLKVLKYLLLPHLEKKHKMNQRQFAYRNATGCLDAIILLKETVVHYNRKHTDVYCAMFDLSKAYIRINISSLCDKIKATYLPELLVNLIEFMGKNTFVSTSYEGCLSDDWKVGNEVHQGIITSGIHFNFDLNEVLTDLSDLPIGCNLNVNRLNIFCFAHDIALLTPTENALQFTLYTLATKLES